MNNYLYWIRTNSREEILNPAICQYYKEDILKELNFTGDTLILEYK